MAFCKNCGTRIEEGMKYCSSCGIAVDGVSIVQQHHQLMFAIHYLARV